MKMKAAIFLTTFWFANFLVGQDLCFAQEEHPYVLVNGKGRQVKMERLKEEMDDYQLIFFGEEHDNVVAHQLTLELLQHLNEELKEEQAKLSFALEMFERDQQAALDSLQKDFYSLAELENHTRVWSNYRTDYQPLMVYCLDQNIPIVASNITREYASFLFKNGREELKRKVGVDTAYLCDLNFQVDTMLSQYAALKEMAVHMNALNFIEAQAIKDATMARSIVEELQEAWTVFHFNGS
jgi:uncharacterized iron-regulated protein